jgi:hypothetical protein
LLVGLGQQVLQKICPHACAPTHTHKYSPHDGKFQ